MFELSSEGKAFVKKELERYEAKESAIIPCLYRAQQENGGWVSDECIEHLSQLMGIPFARIHEVCTFYTMFNRKPVGKFHVQVCVNVSCAMNGGRELMSHLCHHFHTAPGEVSKDGRYTFTGVECLGSCGTAPMMQVNDRYFENLTNDSAVRTLESLD
jgi:NADH-quinone oxidoreductase subunit E